MSVSMMAFLMSSFAVFSQADNERDQLNRMRVAYAKQDKNSLADLLTQWDEDSQRTIRNRPTPKLELEECIDAIYLEVVREAVTKKERHSYYIVQGSLDVVVSDSDIDTLGVDPGNDRSMTQWANYSSSITVHNFTPRLLRDMPRILLLDRSHGDALLKYISGTDDVDLDNRWRIPSSIDGASKRIEFLSPHVSILQGHWRRGWHLESFPMVNVMVVNSKLDRAHIWTRNGHGGALLDIRKQGTEWKRLGAPLKTWSE